MKCLAVMSKNNYQGEDVKKDSDEGKRLAELQATLKQLDEKQNSVKKDLNDLSKLEQKMNTE